MFRQFIITAKAENVFRVLQKLSSLMARKRLKFQEMKLVEADIGRSQLILILWTEEEGVQWLMKQLAKFVDLFDLQMTASDIKNLDWQSSCNCSTLFCLL